MNIKRILAVLLVVMMVISFAGCNYIARPYGAANNGEDISGMLSELLQKPAYDYLKPEPIIKEEEPEEPEEPSKDEDEGPSGDETPQPVPDPIYTPFTSTFDAGTLLSKIETLIKTMKDINGPANSATGVSDELLKGRSVKIMVPDNFPIDEEHEAVKAIASQYGCSVNVRRAGLGENYIAACRNAVLSGDNVDMMYVDNGIWGDIHTFTQPVDNFVNFDLGDKMNTFSSAYSEKFFIQDILDPTVVTHYVAAGMGSPYLLTYNKNNVKTATLPTEKVTIDGKEVTLREILVTDPAEMYEKGAWGINAFTAMLKASTSGSNVGLASEIDRLDGLDIWYGMEDFQGFAINSTNAKTEFNAEIEEELAVVNKTVDVVQDWYWNIKGADSKNIIGAFEKESAYTDGVVYEKLLNKYTGSNGAKSYAFVGSDLQDLGTLDKLSKELGGEWDFVGYPYGLTYENTYRAMSTEEFTAAMEAEEGSEDEIVTPVAGWVGGFAVMKTCANPSVALRVAEEYVKIWKEDYEAPYVELMTDAQKARYEDMKANIGISFIRAWAEKGATVNEAYPGYSKYIYGMEAGVNGGSMTSQDPNKFSTTRSSYLALVFFDGNPDLVTHPIYHKDKASGIYNPSVQTTWSGFMEGAPSSSAEAAKDSGSVARILNASMLPATILFPW